MTYEVVDSGWFVADALDQLNKQVVSLDRGNRYDINNPDNVIALGKVHEIELIEYKRLFDTDIQWNGNAAITRVSNGRLVWDY